MALLTRAADVLASARAQSIRLATAESCTGGLIFAALTEVPGSSDVMDRGFITYSNDAKTEMLGVDRALIAQHGAVSPQVVRAMAEGALERSGAGIAVAVTGVAGPGGTATKPEGMVCFGLARSNKKCQTETLYFGAVGRAEVRKLTTAHALGLIAQTLSASA